MTSVAPAQSSALELHNVTLSYGAEPVLRDVNLSLQPGGSVALIGPNGAGKSTLLRAIVGLLPITSGTISVLGRSPRHGRIDVAYVPQIDALDPEFPVSAAEVVLMGRYRRIGWGRRPNRAERDTALEALDMVGLVDRATDRFGVLSGGQRQRVLIARAVAQQARLLLLDEPFNGVDASTQVVLLDVLQQLRADGVAVAMSTHDLAVAHLACDDCLLVNRRQIAFGPIDNTLTDELLRETYGQTTLQLRHDQATVTFS
jgi:manganese/iron transport system ATP-binding protein